MSSSNPLPASSSKQDVEKLDRFIHPGDASTGVGNGGSGDGTSSLFRKGAPGAPGAGGGGGGGATSAANFDVVTAIRVLKSAGHADHAAELARRHSGKCYDTLTVEA